MERPWDPTSIGLDRHDFSPTRLYANPRRPSSHREVPASLSLHQRRSRTPGWNAACERDCDLLHSSGGLDLAKQPSDAWLAWFDEAQIPGRGGNAFERNSTCVRMAGPGYATARCRSIRATSSAGGAETSNGSPRFAASASIARSSAPTCPSKSRSSMPRGSHRPAGSGEMSEYPQSRRWRPAGSAGRPAPWASARRARSRSDDSQNGGDG